MNTKKEGEFPEVTKEMRIAFVKAREITDMHMVNLNLAIQKVEQTGLKLNTKAMWKAYEGLCRQIRIDEEFYLGKGLVPIKHGEMGEWN